MAATAKQFHEEDAIGKTNDWKVARRLLRYLKPYVRLLTLALGLTLALNLLGILQPMFTKWAIDWYIIPAQIDPGKIFGLKWAVDLRLLPAHASPDLVSGLKWLALGFLGVNFAQLIFSYFQEVLLNTVGQRVMYDLRSELYQ